MDFPLRTLAHKIYFLLETWRSKGPPEGTRQNTKNQKFLQLKVYFTLITAYNSPLKRKSVVFTHKEGIVKAWVKQLVQLS